MTDEERRQLIERLREYHMADCREAADELERLAKELTELKATFRVAAIELGDPRTRQQHPERQRKF